MSIWNKTKDINRVTTETTNKMRKVTQYFLSLLAIALVFVGCKEDDEIVLPKVSFELTTSEIAENATSALALKVMVDQVPSTGLEVPFTLSGTAEEGVNFKEIEPKTVIFEGGSNEAVIFVNPINVGLIEGNKELIITLATASEYELVAEKNSCAVTILDNEAPAADAPVVQFIEASRVSNAYLEEEITVELGITEALANDVVIALDFVGDAVLDTDYTLEGVVSNGVILTAGELNATFKVVIKNTGILDIDKFINVKLAEPTVTDYAVSTEKNTFDVNIIDPKVDFSGAWLSSANLYGYFMTGEKDADGRVLYIDNDDVYQVKQYYQKEDGSFGTRTIYPYVKVNEADANLWGSYRHIFLKGEGWGHTEDNYRYENHVGNIFGVNKLFDDLVSYQNVGPDTDGFIRFVQLEKEAASGKVIVAEQDFIMYKAKDGVDWKSKENNPNGAKYFWYDDSMQTQGDITKSDNVEEIVVKVTGEGTYDLNTKEVIVTVTMVCEDTGFITKNGGNTVKQVFKYIPNK